MRVFLARLLEVDPSPFGKASAWTPPSPRHALWDMRGSITVRLDRDLERSLKRVSKASKRRPSEVVRDALRRQLAVAEFEGLRRRVIVSGGTGAGGRLTLRGVGSTAISAAFESGVAFNIDGVTVSDMRLVTLMLEVRFDF